MEFIETEVVTFSPDKAGAVRVEFGDRVVENGTDEEIIDVLALEADSIVPTASIGGLRHAVLVRPKPSDEVLQGVRGLCKEIEEFDLERM